MIEVGVTLALVLIGFVFGKFAEVRHFKRLDAGEAALADITLLTVRSFDYSGCTRTGLVSGSVVIANDYFKAFVARLKMIFGGRLRTYESMLERARREAVMRMRQEASDSGYHAVVNVRMEFAVIQGSNPSKPGSFEVIAYGTGLGV